MLITNDPWLSAGHFFDITVMVPAFHKDKLVGFFGSTIHHTDIGGYGVGAGARDVHEEGLWIPHAQALRARRAQRGAARDHPAQRAHAGLRVRRPRRAGVERQARRRSGCRHCSTARATTTSSRSPTRSSRAPSGRRARRSASSRPAPITARAQFDVPGGVVITLKAAVTVDTDAARSLIDFAGSSRPGRLGHQRRDELHARLLDVRGALLPQSRPAEQLRQPCADQGQRRRRARIVNCEYPAPVNARHVVGMYVPMPILKALHHVVPERVLAEGSGAVWTMQIRARTRDGEPFTSSMFSFSGGMGARATKPGPSAPPAIRPASPPCRSRCWRSRCRSCSIAGSCATDRAAPAQPRRRRADRRVRRMRTGLPWLLNAVPSGTTLGAGRLGRRRAGRGRAVPRQRQVSERGP